MLKEKREKKRKKEKRERASQVLKVVFLVVMYLTRVFLQPLLKLEAWIYILILGLAATYLCGMILGTLVKLCCPQSHSFSLYLMSGP